MNPKMISKHADTSPYFKYTNVSNAIPEIVLDKHLKSHGGVSFYLSTCVFKPDQWTKAFLNGLHTFGERGGFTGKKVVELGSGCGINLMLVKNIFNPSEIFGSDIHPDVAEVARINIKKNLSQEKQTDITIVDGGHNLDSWMLDTFKADVIFGCLPQVIAPMSSIQNFVGQENEASSHYYQPNEYPLASSDSHAWGLALNEHALKKLGSRISQNGVIILNLGGRPGKDTLLNIFTLNAYTPEILHEEFIEQHIGTSIETLVEQEKYLKNNQKFEFFDSNKKQISAYEAQKLRNSGEKIFHKIYVIAATKN